MEYALTVQDLHKSYGRFKALDGLSMRIPQGAIYGFVGRNGAGKTTLIRTVCGLLHADGGSYTLHGTHSADRGIRTARRRVGALVEAPAVYLNMTAEENLRQQYRILGLRSFDGAEALLALVGLADAGSRKARQFSQGMRQKLGLAMALAGGPELVILDEPANGLDPQGMIELRERIVKLNRERNITFLISSHMLGELSRFATHYGFIDRGRMVRQMTAGELEQACKRSLRMRVSSTERLATALARVGLRHRILSDAEAELYDPVSVTRLAAELIKEDCEIFSCWEQEADLEAYFIDLVGGVDHA